MTVVVRAVVDGELHPGGDVLKREYIGARLPRQDGCPVVQRMVQFGASVSSLMKRLTLPKMRASIHMLRDSTCFRLSMNAWRCGIRGW